MSQPTADQAHIPLNGDDYRTSQPSSEERPIYYTAPMVQTPGESTTQVPDYMSDVRQEVIVPTPPMAYADSEFVSQLRAVTDLIGEGTYGFVLELKPDQPPDRYPVVKLHKDWESYQVENEYHTLLSIQPTDPDTYVPWVQIAREPIRDENGNMLGIRMEKLYTIPPERIGEYVDPAIEAAERLNREFQMAHNDLHPGNVMMDAQGRVKLIDFGMVYVGDEAIRRKTLDVWARNLRGVAKLIGIPEP